MYTYQDLLANSETGDKLKNFIFSAINQHKASDTYKWAVDGQNYIKQQNTTIMNFQKYLYTISGKAFPDNYSANYKTASNFFKRFVTQKVNYLLANGITFGNEDTKGRLGGCKFDRKMYEALYHAAVGEVSFLFWNVDKIEKVFPVTEFVPLWDEESGMLSAGIRFWQLDNQKPMRITLFELDGYTEYYQNKKKELEILKPKRAYMLKKTGTEVDGIESVVGENYAGFPIVQLYANMEHQSELVGLKTEIDCYDLLKSGMANDFDQAQLYWVLKQAGGMEQEDIARFLHQLKTLKATAMDDDGAIAEPHTIDIPYQSRETYLTRLENDMYYDAMTMNAKDITSGNVTATAIRAAYDNLDQAAAEMRMCVESAIEQILALAGIDDQPKFKLNRISNDTELTNNILASAQYLDTQTILEKLPFVEDEEVRDIMDRLTEEESERFESKKSALEEVNGRAGQGEGENGQDSGTDGNESENTV